MKLLYHLSLSICFFSMSFGLVASDVPCSGIPGQNLWRKVDDLGTCLSSMIEGVGSQFEECCSTIEIVLEMIGLSTIENIASVFDNILETVIMIESLADEAVNNLSQIDMLILSSQDTIIQSVCSCIDVSTTELTNEISAIDQQLLSISDAIQGVIISEGDAICSCVEAQVDSVCSCVDATVISTNDLIINELSIIDSQLLSVSDAIQATIISNGDAVCSCVDATVVSINDLLINELSIIDSQLLSVSDAIQTTIISEGDAVCSCVDATVISTYDLLASELSIIDSNVQSVCSCVDVTVNSVGEALATQIGEICSCVDAAVVSINDLLISELSVIDSQLLSISDAIQTTIISDGDAVCSCVDATVISTYDLLATELSIIDSNVQSVCSCVDATVISTNDLIINELSIIDSQLLSVSDAIQTTIISDGDAVCSCVDATVISTYDLLANELSIIDSHVQSVCSCVDATVNSVGEALATEIAGVCSCVDATVISTYDLLASELSVIDSHVQSVCSCVDVTVNSVGEAIITQLDTGEFVSVFGDGIVSGRDDHISFNFQYGISTYDSSTATTGTGTVTNANSMEVVSTGASAASSASLQSLRNLRYRPGHEGYAFFTAAFPSNGVAGSTQWIGLLNNTDGMAVGYNGATFSILYRSNSVNTIIPQSSFNMDTLNGTGPSGFTIIPKNLNVFRLSYGWLGAAPLKFQILSTTGTWITFHVVELPNTITVPSFTNPFLPMQMVVTNTTNTTNVSITSGSWNAGVIGDPRNRAGYRTFIINNAGTNIAAAGTEIHLITIENNTTFNGVPNQIELRFVALGGGPLENTNDAVVLRFRQNATVTGTAFTPVSAGASVVSSSTAGTYTAGTGTIVYVRPTNTTGNGSAPQLFSQSDAQIILLPGQLMTVTGQSYSGAVNTVTGILMWEERF